MALPARFEEELATSPTAGENCRQLLRWNNLELSIRAIAGLLVGAPPPELCCVTEAAALHVIVCDFDYQLRTQRFPGHVLSLAPAALGAWSALFGFTIRFFVLGPIFPGMSGERILAIWRKVFHKLTAHAVGEARDDADMLQRT
jgi:hypothetical protein